MEILPLAKVPFFLNIVMVLWILVSLLLMLVILIQKGRGGGLGAAFGGGGAQSLLGTKTGDVLTWVTISLVALFLFLAVVLVKFYKPVVSAELGGTTPPAGAVEAPTTAPVEGGEETPTEPVAPAENEQPQ